MEVVLFVSTIVCTIVLALNLYVLESTESINIEILVALPHTALTVGVTFGYFYLSEVITSNLLDVGDFFYDSSWYRLPANRQRLLMLPIQRAQSEFRLRGLGIVDASLPVFASVRARLGKCPSLLGNSRSDNEFFLGRVQYFSADNQKRRLLFPYDTATQVKWMAIMHFSQDRDTLTHIVILIQKMLFDMHHCIASCACK